VNGIEQNLINEIVKQLDRINSVLEEEEKYKEVRELIKKKLKEIKELIQDRKYEEAFEVVVDLMDKLRKINFVKYAALLKVLETLADVIEKAVQVKRNKKKLVDHLSVMELLALKFELEERIAARRRESKLKEEALASTELNEREEDVKEEKEEKKTLTLAAAHLKEEEERIKEKEQEIKSKQKSAFKAVEDLRQKPPREIKAPKPPRPY